MTNNWPESVPWLTAKDITKKYDFNGVYRGTFAWWLNATFRGDGYGAAQQALYLEVCKLDSELGICTIHESKRATKSRMAKMWNAAMKSLGYAEIGDATE